MSRADIEVSFSAYMISQKVLSLHPSNDTYMSKLSRNAIIGYPAGIIIGINNGLPEGRPFMAGMAIDWSHIRWGYDNDSTIVSTATLAIASRNIGATKASVLGVFEPITAILVGTVVFGEALTANIITGILISIVAVSFMIMVTKR